MASGPYKAGMELDPDLALGADPDYRSAREETSEILDRLRERLLHDKETWDLVVELEDALQCQVVLALDVGVKLGKRR